MNARRVRKKISAERLATIADVQTDAVRLGYLDTAVTRRLVDHRIFSTILSSVRFILLRKTKIEGGLPQNAYAKGRKPRYQSN